MTKKEREYYELRQLMGNTENRIDKPSEIDQEYFRGYKYKKQTRKLNVSDKLIYVWLEHPNPQYKNDLI